MREINNIVDFESFKSAINRLDKMAATEPSKINIDFPKDGNRAKDFFDKFFEIADGNPEWND
jgi:hypothetical protein